jgi:hypothetical protein
MKKLIAISGLAVALLSASAPAFALGDRFDNLRNRRDVDRQTVAAPEIDVSAGTKGIAVLIAGLLLAAEGLRRRR